MIQYKQLMPSACVLTEGSCEAYCKLLLNMSCPTLSTLNIYLHQHARY